VIEKESGRKKGIWGYILFKTCREMAGELVCGEFLGEKNRRTVKRRKKGMSLGGVIKSVLAELGRPGEVMRNERATCGGGSVQEQQETGRDF